MHCVNSLYLWPSCSISKPLGTANHQDYDRQRWWDIHRRLLGFISWLCLCKRRAFENWWNKRIYLQWASISWQLVYCDELLIFFSRSCSILNCASNQLQLGGQRTCDSHIKWWCQWSLGRQSFYSCHRYIYFPLLVRWSMLRLCRRLIGNFWFLLWLDFRHNIPHSRNLLRP